MPYVTTSRTAVPAPKSPRRLAVRRDAPVSDPGNAATARRMREIHDEVTRFFERLDGGGRFREDAWERPGGGGGVSRVLENGNLWEKAGVNWSAVDGVMPAAAAAQLGATLPAADPVHFFATGVSVVVHPRSPLVPTIHLNVRAFVLSDSSGREIDAWYGGGTDLTPTYPYPEDAAHFHRALRAICDRHDGSFYPRFKGWCDRYFVNKHRGDESRGIGGVFFDHLRPAEVGRSEADLFRFVSDVGLCLPQVYEPIVRRRRDLPYGERERTLQLHRRGRYIEFNLVHDRGTRFGLETNARMESVLMSLPPAAAWPYSPDYLPGSIEANLMEMLKPRDWAGVGAMECCPSAAVA
jgi:coproporphyrinogen III oxidase